MYGALHLLKLMALFGAPSVVVFLWIIQTKRRHVAKARRPFTVQPLRVAGESTREKADELFDSASEDLLFLLAGPLFGLLLGFTTAPISWPITAILLAGVAIGSYMLGKRIQGKLKKSWNYRLGAIGEQVVGRELDQLMSQGYQIFHDVQFGGWNIDHIVVGPKGVFAVETKTWRKPSAGSNISAKIVFDGEALSVPGKWKSDIAIQQARGNAKSLSKWIAKAAAENVPVVPIVALPGWSLEVERLGDVAVFSATKMGDPMIRRGESDLRQEQIQRICFQLAKCCEVTSA
jgi:hypothetical protein